MFTTRSHPSFLRHKPQRASEIWEDSELWAHLHSALSPGDTPALLGAFGSHSHLKRCTGQVAGGTGQVSVGGRCHCLCELFPPPSDTPENRTASSFHVCTAAFGIPALLYFKGENTSHIEVCMQLCMQATCSMVQDFRQTFPECLMYARHGNEHDRLLVVMEQPG